LYRYNAAVAGAAAELYLRGGEPMKAETHLTAALVSARWGCAR
jgi:hypothetical protein